MTEAHIKPSVLPKAQEREINWAQYLDYTLFIETGELGNDDLDRFQKDLYP